MNKNLDAADLAKHHNAAFGIAPEVIAFAPGRVNFIGEHTDYNGGLVMPAAINLGVMVAASKLSTDILEINSLDFNKRSSFNIATLKRDDTLSWANCPKGAVAVMREKYSFAGGCALSIMGNIPLGSGLSSSAACEVAVGKALAALYKIDIAPINLALAAQEAEHKFTGTLCGIMDQAASALGKKDCLIKLDCARLEWEYIPFSMPDHTLYIVNTGVKHNLADGEYNKRRKECADALDILHKNGIKGESLASIEPCDIKKFSKELGEINSKRAMHVSTEQRRVLRVGNLLNGRDFKEVGPLLTESHSSLKNDYEVSCVELDFLVENALLLPSVCGARMTGGGFGGCMIALIERKSENSFSEVIDAYKTRFGLKPMVFAAKLSDGASLLSI